MNGLCRALSAWTVRGYTVTVHMEVQQEATVGETSLPQKQGESERDLPHHRGKMVPFCAEKVVGSETNWVKTIQLGVMKGRRRLFSFILQKKSNIYLTAWIQGPFFHAEPSCQSYCRGFDPSSGQRLCMCGSPPQSSYMGLSRGVWVCEWTVCVSCDGLVTGDNRLPWIYPHCLYISISSSQKTESGIWRHFLKYLFWFL